MANQQTANILIVDDTPDSLRVLAQMLAERGYEIRPATSGQAALLTIKAKYPDLILLDIMMPDMDGYQLCELLKIDDATKDVPIIFISALDQLFNKVKAFELGGVDYITKPFQAEEVLARVETHLTLQQLRQELAEHNKLLAQRVAERTAELASLNQQLRTEIEERKRHQIEKEKVYELVWQQSEQLRTMSQYLLENQRRERQGLAQTLHDQVAQNLQLLQKRLMLMQQTLLDTIQLQDTPVHKIFTGQLQSLLNLLQPTLEHLETVTEELNQPSEDETQLQQNPLLQLSDREREVLYLWKDGLSNSEIAVNLNLSIQTIYTYRRRIMRKLDVDNLPDLMDVVRRYDE